MENDTIQQTPTEETQTTEPVSSDTGTPSDNPVQESTVNEPAPVTQEILTNNGEPENRPPEWRFDQVWSKYKTFKNANEALNDRVAKLEADLAAERQSKAQEIVTAWQHEMDAAAQSGDIMRFNEALRNKEAAASQLQQVSRVPEPTVEKTIPQNIPDPIVQAADEYKQAFLAANSDMMLPIEKGGVREVGGAIHNTMIADPEWGHLYVENPPAYWGEVKRRAYLYTGKTPPAPRRNSPGAVDGVVTQTPKPTNEPVLTPEERRVAILYNPGLSEKEAIAKYAKAKGK